MVLLFWFWVVALVLLAAAEMDREIEAGSSIGRTAVISSIPAATGLPDFNFNKVLDGGRPPGGSSCQIVRRRPWSQRVTVPPAPVCVTVMWWTVSR